MKKSLFALLISMGAANVFAARLPQAVIPQHYDLEIGVDLANETFQGEETIQVAIRQPVNTVTMHAVDLDIRSASIDSAAGRQVATVTTNAADETITLTVPATMPAGGAAVAIKFNGKLSKQLRGLYLSKTTKRKYAVTQFESTDARRAFPSFDEPAMKARFTISLVVDKGDTAITNTPIVADEPAGEGKHRLRFATTEKMSTYLVAMLIGDFDCIEGGVDGIPIRVCGPAGNAAKYGHFALSAAESSLHWFNQYYDVKYPFGKLDMIAIPDFEAGAMENAGAITYRETAIFIDPSSSSYERQKGVAGTVAHEIAHQWFGDLVTMKWWDDIWLNEGFASFMTQKPLAQWKPEWNIPLSEVSSSMTSLNVDSQRATRAIRTPAETPEEINQLFDGIAYGKTAAVLRMLERWLGPETFRDGIRAYLKKYSWSNATAEDLWDTLAAASGKPVNVVMKSFVDQPGAPLLRVTERCADGKQTFTFTQERMLAKAAKGPAPKEQTWVIPVCSTPSDCTIVDAATSTHTAGPCGSTTFVNDDGRGYFVTDYAPKDRAALRGKLSKLSAEERIAFEGNEWLMVRSLRRDVDDYLELLRAMPRPQSRQLTENLVGHLGIINDRLITDSNRKQWQRAVGELIRGYAPLQWDTPKGETAEQRSTRGYALWVAGYMARDPKVIAGARKMADQYLKDPTGMDASIAGTALGVAAVSGDADLYRRVRERLASAPTAELRDRMANLLADFRDPKLIAETIDYAFSDSVRSQDLPRLIGGLFENPASRDAAWAAVTERWPVLERKIPTALHRVTGALGSFCDAKSKQEIETFFAKTDATRASRSLKRSLEAIDTCMAFREAQTAALQRFLKKGTPSLPKPSRLPDDLKSK